MIETDTFNLDGSSSSSSSQVKKRNNNKNKKKYQNEELPSLVVIEKGSSGKSLISSPIASLKVVNDEKLNTPHSPSLERFSAMSKPRESILTTPESDIGWGTFNYIAICYVMAGFSMMADNYISKGTIVETELFWWLTRNVDNCIYLALVQFAWSFVNYACTWTFVKHKIPSGLSIFLYVVWQFALFYASMTYILSCDLSPILSGGTGLQLCVISLKNHSYWHTNYFLAKGYTKAMTKSSPITRRDLTPNISISHFLYFMFAPTLVFETQFPRTRSIRYSYILKESLAAAGAFFMFYLVLCRTSPIYKLIDTQPLILLIIQLSLPSMSLWMLGFYGVFHCLLNIFAEITMFADREFYQDWWNATTFDQWWRKWNRPVHKWMLRHVYRDSMHTVKLNKFGAFLSTFLLSALLHELIMIISFRFVRPILSTSMLLQIGLVYFTQLPLLQKTRFGNVIMWASVFVGQPLVQLLYSTQYSVLIWNPTK